MADFGSNLDSDIELLSRVPLFEAMTTDQLRLLAFSLVRKDLEAGEVLFRKGDKAASGFVVAHGAIELSLGEGAERRVLETCNRGFLIGELPLFIETKRPATATAVSPGMVVELSRQLMLRMLNEFPRIAAAMQARVAGRVGGTIAELRRVQDRLLSIGTRR
jgi:CRP-like cAMP-binding protein